MTPSTYFFTQALKKKGLTVQHISSNPSLFEIKEGYNSETHTPYLCHTVKTPLQSSTCRYICNDKFVSKQLLEYLEIQTAKSIMLTADTIYKTADLQFPIVLKPLDRFGGAGVVTNIQSQDEVQKYFDTFHFDEVLAEETLIGKDYRVLLINNRFIAACERLPAAITGNGVDTIQTLLQNENQARQQVVDEQKKQGKFTTAQKPILDNIEIDKSLETQGLNRESVPKKDEKIFVRKNANVSSGGSTIDVTDAVHPYYIEICEKISRQLGASILGVDIMTPEISVKPEEDSPWGVVEINANPDLTLHYLVDEGQARDPFIPLADMVANDIARFN